MGRMPGWGEPQVSSMTARGMRGTVGRALVIRPWPRETPEHWRVDIPGWGAL